MLRDEIREIIWDAMADGQSADWATDRIMELPEIKQAERMREKVKEAIGLLTESLGFGCGEYPDCTCEHHCKERQALTILKEADHE